MKPKEWYNTVCLDFDGVIAKFGTVDAGEVVPGAIAGLYRLLDAGWYVEIYSGRSATSQGIQVMKDWMEEADNQYRVDDLDYSELQLNDLGEYYRQGRLMFAENKPVAKIYVDDRGLKFEGWDTLTPEVLEAFRAWWQHSAATH